MLTEVACATQHTQKGPSVLCISRAAGGKKPPLRWTTRGSLTGTGFLAFMMSRNLSPGCWKKVFVYIQIFISLLGMIRCYMSAGNLTAQFPGLQIVEATSRSLNKMCWKEALATRLKKSLQNAKKIVLTRNIISLFPETAKKYPLFLLAITVHKHGMGFKSLYCQEEENSLGKKDFHPIWRGKFVAETRQGKTFPSPALLLSPEGKKKKIIRKKSSQDKKRATAGN